MPEPTKTKLVLVAVRLPADLLDSLDEVGRQLAVKNPGLYTTRAEVLRVLLYGALRERVWEHKAP